MERRIAIGIAVVLAIGLIWTTAVMFEWVPITSANGGLGIPQ